MAHDTCSMCGHLLDLPTEPIIHAILLLQILERVLLAEQPTKVVYLGDGRGDFCACTRLGPSDAILARAVYPDGRPAALLQLLAAEAATIQAGDGQKITSVPIPAANPLP